METVGFIGAGRMGYALMESLLRNGAVKKSNLLFCEKNQETANKAVDELGAKQVRSVEELAEGCAVVFVAVLPDEAPAVVRALAPRWEAERHVLVSVCAGVSLGALTGALHPAAKVVRLMPNAPAMVGAMTGVFALNGNFGPKETDEICALLGQTGTCYRIAEEEMGAATAISGCGPGFIGYLLKAFVEAGTEAGLKREDAGRLAVETLQGTAELLKVKGMSAEELVDMVCTPNGVTWTATNVLEKEGAAKAVRACVFAARDKSVEVGKHADGLF